MTALTISGASGSTLRVPEPTPGVLFACAEELRRNDLFETRAGELQIAHWRHLWLRILALPYQAPIVSFARAEAGRRGSHTRERLAGAASVNPVLINFYHCVL